MTLKKQCGCNIRDNDKYKGLHNYECLLTNYIIYRCSLYNVLHARSYRNFLLSIRR